MTPSIWLGTEDSFHHYLFSAYRMMDKFGSDVKLRESFAIGDPVEDIIDVHGNVGIVSIDGPLIDTPDMFDRIMGVTSYSDITEGINRHLEDKKVSDIVLVMNTPGGDASGIGEVSNFIADAKNVKPITSWTGKSALSAGYWIASSASKLRASRMAEVGSIGAIATVTSVARMLKEEGIDVHVERAGTHKALIHPAEELSDEGKKVLKAKVGQLHDFFLEHVTGERPQLKMSEKSKWGEGQTYFTDEAIGLGLVDGPAMSLGELVTGLQARSKSKSGRGQTKMAESCHNGKLSQQTKEAGMKTKQVLLSDEARAQLASGAPLEAVAHTLAETETEIETGEAEETPVETKEPDTSGTETKAEEKTEKGNLAEFLQARLEARESEMMELKVQKTQMETQLTALKDVESTLQPIAVEAINRLQIALGQSPSNMKGLPAASLAEQYAALKDDFNKRFKAGPVAQGASDESREGRSLAELRIMSSGRKAA